VQFLYKICVKNFSFLEDVSEIWSEIYVGIYVKYRLSL